VKNKVKKNRIHDEINIELLLAFMKNVNINVLYFKYETKKYSILRITEIIDSMKRK